VSQRQHYRVGLQGLIRPVLDAVMGACPGGLYGSTRELIRFTGRRTFEWRIETPVLEVIGMRVQDIRQTSSKCPLSAGWTAYDTIEPSKGVGLVTIVSAWCVVRSVYG
jgi:hypothetical protein